MGVGILRKMKDAASAVGRGLKRVASVAKPVARKIVDVVGKHGDKINQAADFIGMGAPVRAGVSAINKVGGKLAPILRS